MNSQKSERPRPPGEPGGQLIRRAEIRWRPDEYAQIEERARVAMVSVSEFVRRAALGKPLSAPVDRQLVGELRRLGALIKRQYPGTTTWTPEERRRYWETREQLLKLARRIGRETGRNSREDAS